MAELEVIKHTKKINEIFKTKKGSFWSRLWDFLLEIVIIVFAVSLSIGFHDYNENRHVIKDVAMFLQGLKSDLENDIKEMNVDKQSFEKQKKAFAYVTSIKIGQSLNGDSIRIHSPWIFNITALVPNNGRYEGFKASGRIGDIANTELQNDILDFYQEDIMALLANTSLYAQYKQKLLDYVNNNKKKLSDSTSNIAVVLSSDIGQNLCSGLARADGIIRHYDKCIAKAAKIIETINAMYKSKD